MIKITSRITLHETEIEFQFMRAQGPGGQNVNKVETAVQLYFNVADSASLSEDIRARILAQEKRRINSNGILIIKASRFRTQARNKADAIERLKQIIARAAIQPKKRKKTKPTRVSVEKRLSEKKVHGKKKQLRRQTRELT